MSRRHIIALAAAVAIGSGLSAAGASAQSTPARRAARADSTIPTTLETLRWRHIGPAAFGGRIADLAVDPTNPSVLYVGAASGGIFKSVNRGDTWTPIFDEAGGSLSIGALAIAPSDPQIIWAGTGEPNNRQSSSWGDGVYRSLDGGRHWTRMGLEDTHHIGRIAIHPTDPNIVYVAALGHLWGPNAERGVYRTRDGGRSWQRVLTIDAETGAVDLVLDPDGRTILAATYQRRRRAFGFVGGGPGSGIHRSIDGGDRWERVNAGLPTGAIGRIGLTQARSDARILYAIVEHATAGGVYRSDDRGLSWQRRNPLNPRPMYYSTVRVDPTNPDRLWLLDAYLFRSTDGGRTFTSDRTGEGIHTDHHALWIDPVDPQRMLLGGDGGLYATNDGARSWRFLDNLPIGQYYDISVDDREPYRVYGGLQDNGTWALPSRSYTEDGIRNSDIIHLAPGDGFFVTPDPRNPRYVFANSQNGRAYVVDTETREQQLIRPAPADTSETYRFGWSTPMLVSPHDSTTYYYGGHRLFRTSDRGQQWEAISPDLSRGERWEAFPIMGMVRDSATLSRDDGVSDYGTISALDESPLRRGMLLIGTDDGRVQLTTDGGAAWTDITARFRLPAARWVSRVVASRHDAKVAYVAFDGHQDDDFAPYLFRTADGGTTWSAIGGGIPHGMVINAVAEHPDNAAVLLVGTEFGLVVSYDAGRSWKRAGGNLPRVPIDDIVVHPRTRDIVLGTHGRSLIVLDDTRLLALGDADVVATPRLVTPTPAILVNKTRAVPNAGSARYAGDNPSDGALLTYAIPARSASRDSVRLIIRGSDGSTIRELAGPGTAGMHRIAWDLRYALPFTPVASDAVWFGPPRGAWVLPGTYTVVLRTAAGDQTAPLEVRGDPRSAATREVLVARHDAGRALHDMLRAWADADRSLASLTRAIGADTAAVTDRASYPAQVAALRESFRSGWGSLKSRMIDLHGAIQGATAPPTQGQTRTLAALRAEMLRDITALNGAIAGLASWRGEAATRIAAPSPVRPPSIGGE